MTKGTTVIDGMPAAGLRGLPMAQQTLPALLWRQAARFGDKILLRTDDVERSYAEMTEAVAATAGTLLAAGVRAGDRVALMCENRLEILDVALACAWLGAVAVPLNTALRGPALSHQLTNSDSKLLLMDSALLGVLTDVPPPPELREVWALDGIPDDVPAAYRVVVPPPAGEPVPAADVRPDTTSIILYTSGTTGPAKGVECPQAQFYWWGILVSESLEIDEQDILYTCLPLFHTNALAAFMQAMVSGATIHVGPRFSASRYWERIAEARATVTYLLGAIVNILCAAPVHAAETAHRVRVALAPGVPAPLLEQFRSRFGITLVEGYGSTETNGCIGAPPGEQRPGWMGRVRTGFSARVVDEFDAQVPDGTPGELLLRADEPFAFASGYHAEPAKTVEVWRNLWFHTGDAVVRSADGWLRFVDRLKDTIRRRGENISSFEVEQVLLAHDDVDVAAAYALPSELGEDEVAAAVVLAPGSSLEPADLVRWCEPRLAYFAIPRFLCFVEELPTTTNGKVRKEALRQRGTEGLWDRQEAGLVVNRSDRSA
ncbi:ATP-dependent acyl-CoA ligase [Amycolatopsis lurida]